MTEPVKYMLKYGQAVADNGYRIVPIKPMSKVPLGLDWSQRELDADSLPSALADGYTHDYWSDRVARIRGTRTWRVDAYGIGILAAETPAVDIDVRDEAVSAHMLAFVEDLLGKTIRRTGLAPKSMLLYRCDKPFGKVNSTEYVDSAGLKSKVEILASGQQFVALAVHPDTQKPYKWLDKQGPHNTPVADLPLITVEDARAIKEEFERVAAERGWAVLKPSAGGLTTVGARNADDPFAGDAPKVVGVPIDELARLLMLVPNFEEHDFWVQIGMALFHQFDGSDEGLALWHRWSGQWAGYDADVLDMRWSSFDIEGKGRSPVTAALILKHAYEVEKTQIAERMDDAIKDLLSAHDANQLQTICAKYKTIAFSALDRERLIGTLRTAYKRLTDQPLSLTQARKMLVYENPDASARHSWCDGWVYNAEGETSFENLVTGVTLSPKAFDGIFSKCLISRVEILEGKTTPTDLPQNVARNSAQIPSVLGKRYMPGLGPLFSLNDVEFMNRYSERNVPAVPQTWTPEGKRAVELVEAHAVHLLENDRDRRLFLDALAYVVQSLDRLNWGIFMQGAEGDGKTFWGVLMAAVIGYDNAPIIRGADLKEKYTGWAENGLFLTVEEVRLTGEHRYDAVNNIKTMLTNSRVTIRRMGIDQYTTVNRTTYFLTSNYKDGLPAAESRRYLVLYSRWQLAEKLEAFVSANPDYFHNLYGCLSEAGSLRRWLLERRISDDFDPRGRAPETSAREEMRLVVQDDETSDLRRVLDDGAEADFSRALLDSALLEDRMNGQAPQGRRLSQLLNQAGLTYVGETGFGGKTRRWWSDQPSSYRITNPDGKTKIDAEAVRKHLDNWL